MNLQNDPFYQNPSIDFYQRQEPEIAENETNLATESIDQNQGPGVSILPADVHSEQVQWKNPVLNQNYQEKVIEPTQQNQDENSVQSTINMVNQFLNQNKNQLEVNFENKNKIQEVESDSDAENTEELLDSQYGAKNKNMQEKDCLDSSLSDSENSLLNTNYVDKDSDDEKEDEIQQQHQQLTLGQQVLQNALNNQQTTQNQNSNMLGTFNMNQNTGMSQNFADEFLGEIKQLSDQNKIL